MLGRVDDLGIFFAVVRENVDVGVDDDHGFLSGILVDCVWIAAARCATGRQALL